MPRIQYDEIRRMHNTTKALILAANKIIAEYLAANLKLTLRQLHYQFVGRDLYKNTDKNYDLLGRAISTGRLVGLVDWDAITDRLRELQHKARWKGPRDALKSLHEQYRIDLWRDQPTRVEVWVEKDALSDIVESVSYPLGVDYMICRGFQSQSAMWEAGRRFKEYLERGQQPVILYFGDHDPSGLEMPRDIETRINKFAETNTIEVVRVALTREQVEEFNCPPNPAKMTDSRSAGYVAEHGDESWELDALPPEALSRLIDEAIRERMDVAKFEARLERNAREKQSLLDIAENYNYVVKALENKPPKENQP